MEKVSFYKFTHVPLLKNDYQLKQKSDKRPKKKSHLVKKKKRKKKKKRTKSKHSLQLELEKTKKKIQCTSPYNLHKYKCLWDVGDKGWGSSLQEGALHTYTLRLG